MYSIAEFWNRIQPNLFTHLETALDEKLTPKIQALEVIANVTNFLSIFHLPSCCLHGLAFRSLLRSKNAYFSLILRLFLPSSREVSIIAHSCSELVDFSDFQALQLLGC